MIRLICQLQEKNHKHNVQLLLKLFLPHYNCLHLHSECLSVQKTSLFGECNVNNIQMVIYSGFSTRRQEQKYNHLIKQLLHLLSQMIITYIESAKIMAFRQSYEKIQFEISKMDQYKYSDIKVSLEIEPLTQHIINGDLASEILTEPLKRKTDHRPVFRTKRSLHDGTTRSIESAKPRPKDEKRRSLSITSDKNMSRKVLGESQSIGQPTMEELMSMHPLIERKMGNIRKKRYFKQRNTNNFALIQEEDEQGEDKQ